MFIETLIRLLGGLLAYTTLVLIFYGLWRGTQRHEGRTSGRTAAWLRSPLFYLVTSAIFFGLSYLCWIPLPLKVSPAIRPWLLAIGTLLYFPGILVVLWGRLALGKNYFVSTGFGAQLFAGHQLVTSGPFAIVRHPMYAGLIVAAVGSLLIYYTWTTLLFAGFAPFLCFRARREEATLAAEFGNQWRDYCKFVPPFIPRLIAREKKPRLKLPD
jgi:protein-S-isoprenylcysteine O-methyltransferase Ste14